MKTLSLVLAPVILAACGAASAQDPVTPAADQDALFHSKDPKLDANKQAVYHIFKDLLQAKHWELADKYLTKRYIQHNPNAKSGLDGARLLLHASDEGEAGSDSGAPVLRHRLSRRRGRPGHRRGVARTNGSDRQEIHHYVVRSVPDGRRQGG